MPAASPRTPPAEPYDVFISYSHRDIEAARRLEARLTGLGLTVWRDEKRLTAGDNYVFTIHDGIDRARRVVVLWSEAAIASEYVTAEAFWGRSNKKLVDLEVEPCAPKVPFNIRHRLPLKLIEADAPPLLRALGAVQEPGGTVRIFSLEPSDVDTSKMPLDVHDRPLRPRARNGAPL
jgi:hypothetical protein